MLLYPLMQCAGTDDCPSLQQGKRYMSMTSQSGLTGLQQLRELAASGRKIEIGETLGFRLAEVEEGRAVFESKPGRHLYSPIGTVHGGFAATLVDSARACAVHSQLGPTQGCTTLELKVAYHKTITADTRLLRADRQIVKFRRRAAFAEERLTAAERQLDAYR